MSEFFILFLVTLFNKRQEDNLDGYVILKLDLPQQVLLRLYNKTVSEGLAPIEKLPVEQKERYWKIAKKYFNTQEEAIIQSKVFYIFDLVIQN